MNTNATKLREHWAKVLPLIQAFLAGEEIEYARTATGPYHSTKAPDFGLCMHYRIKPKPQWRPYKLEDGDEIPKFALAVRKGGCVPRAFKLNGDIMRFIEAGEIGITSFDDLFHYYDRLDQSGTTSPFGVFE